MSALRILCFSYKEISATAVILEEFTSYYRSLSVRIYTCFLFQTLALSHRHFECYVIKYIEYLIPLMNFDFFLNQTILSTPSLVRLMQFHRFQVSQNILTNRIFYKEVYPYISRMKLVLMV